MATTHLDKSPPTIPAAIDTYLTHIRNTSTRATTQASQQALNLFIQLLSVEHALTPHKLRPADLRVGWFQDYLRFLQDTRAIETEHLYSRAILDFYKFANDNNWITLDINQLADYLAHERRPKRHLPPQPPMHAIDTLLANLLAQPAPAHDPANIRDYLRALRDTAVLLTLANTGLKVSEICALRRHTFDRHSHTLSLPQGNILVLPSHASRAITTYLTARAEADGAQHRPLADLPLFARHDKRAGKRILPISRWTAANIINEAVTRLLPDQQRADLVNNNQSISAQTFRHYFISTTLQRTGNIAQTQALARHADRSTTRRYGATVTPTATAIPADGPPGE